MNIALLGSGEFQTWTIPVDRWLLEHSANKNGKVLIFPTASAPEGDDIFNNWADMGYDHFQKLAADAKVIELKTRDDAYKHKFIHQLKGAGAIVFSGGNPAYLVEVLLNTPFMAELLEIIKAGVSFEGCSAGATMLGRITFDISKEDLTRDMLSGGLSVFPNWFILPHYNMMDSYKTGMRQFVFEQAPKDTTLVGIDEDTAMVGDGKNFSVMGSGSIFVKLPGMQEHTYPAGQTLALQ